MKIELKSLKVFEEMSEETTAFVGDLFVNGKKVAYGKNDGHGGETYFHPYEGMRGLLREAEAYCKSLPPHKTDFNGKPLEFDQSLEFVVDMLIEAKEQEKFDKKRDKACVKAFVYGTKNGYASRGWKKIKSLGEIPRTNLQATYDKLKGELKGTDKKIFNSEKQLQTLGIRV